MDILKQTHWLPVWNHFFDREAKVETHDPNGACISTIGLDGFPNARFVLIKSVSESGFLFYTNLNSQKGQELKACPNCALTWWSRKQDKQVRVQGIVDYLDPKAADTYWESRCHHAKVSASISKQSEPLTDRKTLLDEWHAFDDAFADKPIPRPKHWTGVCLQPLKVEFWSAIDGEYQDRLHQRILFSKVNDGWKSHEMYP